MQAPNFSLYDPVDERHVSLEEYAGKPLLLTFWTSWCPDSQIDLEKKALLYTNMQTIGLDMLFVNVTGRERKTDQAIEFMNNRSNDLPYVLDEGIDTYRKYKCEGVPTTVMINKDGGIESVFGDQTSFTEIMKHVTTWIR